PSHRCHAGSHSLRQGAANPRLELEESPRSRILPLSAISTCCVALVAWNGVAGSARYEAICGHFHRIASAWVRITLARIALAQIALAQIALAQGRPRG